MSWLRQLQKDGQFHHWLRRQKDKILLPLVQVVAAFGITANGATIIGLVIGLASVYILLQGSFIWFAILMSISMLMDGIDGELARLKNTTSKQGALLDYWVDTLLTIVMFVGLAIYVSQLWWIVGLIVLLFMIELLHIVKSPVHLVPGRMILLVPSWFGLPVIGLGLLSLYGVVMGIYGLFVKKPAAT